MVVLACALAASACAGAAPVQTDVAGRADAAATCRPADLKALFRGFQPTGDSLSGAVVVTDAGSSVCWLDGSPRSITLLNDGGAPVSVRNRSLDVPPNGTPVELQPGVALPTFGAPPARGSAWFSLSWTNWCSDTAPAVRSMLVVLPAGGSIDAQLDAAIPSWATAPATPRCADSRAGSTLSFGRFQGPGV